VEAVAEGGSAQGVGFWSLDGSEQDQADMSVRPTWNGVRFWGLVGAEAPHFLAGFTGLKPGATVRSAKIGWLRLSRNGPRMIAKC